MAREPQFAAGLRPRNGLERDADSAFGAGTPLDTPNFRLGGPDSPRSEANSGLPPGFDPIWGTLGAQTQPGGDDWLAREVDDADEPAVDVAVLGDGFQISGQIRTGKFERLSDWINMQTGFIQVFNAEQVSLGQIRSLDPTARKGNLWVRLDQIVLMAERSSGQVERPGSPAVSKQRQMVSIVTPGYRLRGDMHLHTNGSMNHFLQASDPHFLPITDLTVRRLSDATTVAHFAFAAINRRQLVTLLDESAQPVHDLVEDLDRVRDAVAR